MATTAPSWRRCAAAISISLCRPCLTTAPQDYRPYRSPPTPSRSLLTAAIRCARGRRPQPSNTLAYPWVLPGRDVLYLRSRLEALFRVAGLEPPPAKIEDELRSPSSLQFCATATCSPLRASRVLPSEMDGVVPLPIPGLTMTRSAGILFRSTAGIHASDARFHRGDQEACARTRNQLSVIHTWQVGTKS